MRNLTGLNMRSKKLTVIISLLIVAAFTIFNVVNYILLSNTYLEHIASENTRDTEVIAKNVSSYIENAYNLTQEMALNQAVTSMKPMQQKEFLNAIIKRYPFIDNLFIQKTDGIQIARAKGENANRSQRWWFKRMIADNRSFVSKSFYSLGTAAVGNYPVTSIYFPIYRGQDYVGIFATDLRLDIFQEYVKRLNSGAGRVTYILDGEGTVIAHPDRDQVAEMYNYKTATKTLVVRDSNGNAVMEDGNQKLKSMGIVLPQELRQITQKVLQGETGEAEYTDLKGNRVICFYRPISLPGTSHSWAVITVYNRDIALAPVNKFFMTNIAITLIIVLCLVFIIWWQTKQLEQAYREIATSNGELQEINASLEEEISERNKVEAQLSAANQELTAVNEEMSAMNEELSYSNERLATEIAVRRQTEKELLLKDEQYHATVGLLVHNEDITNLLPRILTDALGFLQAPNGYIALVNQEQDAISLYCGYGIYKNLIDEPSPLNQGVHAAVYSTGRLMYIEDYRQYPDRLDDIRQERITSIIVVPLKSRGQVIGVFAACWIDDIHPASKAELEVLQQYGDLASIALESVEARSKIKYMAYHDALTGLLNRASLTLHLEQELARAKEEGTYGAVLFIDIDDLKMVNDTLGHTAGDAIIIKASEKIAEGAVEGALVARIGGDEFIVLLPGQNDRPSLGESADHMLQLLNTEYQVGENSLYLSASMGIALYPMDGICARDILKNADNAMYAAKHAGKNRWRFYEASMETRAYEKIILTNSLRNAINRGELCLYYQPKINIQDGSISGFEALLRWNSPEHGMVSPMRFISLAEQSGLIQPIGEWVLQESCRFAKKLANMGFERCRVAANVSPGQLTTDNFVGIVCGAVNEAGIQSAQLEIEITESVVLHSLEDGILKLQQLSDMGVQLSLDDFGTGYSSLTHLRRLPVKTLKMDKSFIDNIPEDSAQTMLVKSIIEMAHVLDLKVVAEGVEKEEQYIFLKSFGCDCVQGYLCSKPLPEEKAIAFLTSRY